MIVKLVFSYYHIYFIYMNDVIKFVVVIILLTTIYLYIDAKNSNLIYERAELDGNMYLVRNVEDKAKAANLLASIRQKLERVINYLVQKYPDQDNVVRLKTKFRPENIEESEAGSKYTSYSVNKGEKIVFCIRSKDKEARLEDENLLIFVALHEVGHVMTLSTGHTDEFWDNFRFLLKESIKIGVYKRQDFKKNPQKYCGTKITDSPLDD
jgi:predicted metal-dependent hydrolase